MGRKKYYRGQLASFCRLAYPCNQANEKKKKKKNSYDQFITSMWGLFSGNLKGLVEVKAIY